MAFYLAKLSEIIDVIAKFLFGPVVYFVKKFVFCLVIFFCFFPIGAFAIDDLAVTSLETRVFTRGTLASNPECGDAAKTIGFGVGFGSIGAGMVSIGIAIPLFLFGPPPYAQPAAVSIGLAGMGAIAAGSLYAGEYLACAFSYVKHPVMRFESNGPGWAEGDYKECEDLDPKFPSQCDKVFQTEKEYFICIDKALGGIGDFDRGQIKEPKCRSGRYIKTDRYVWPKNRDTSNSFIEVCYRNPVGAGYVLSSGLLGILINLNIGLEPREKDYGDADLHRYKALFNGDIECQVLKAYQRKIIHGVKFGANHTVDGRICAHTVGLGEFAWPEQSIVGCHLRKSGPPAPRCSAARLVTSPDGSITSYDESKCKSCFISESCIAPVGAHTLAPFPVSSILVECLRESLNSMLSGGCADPLSGNGTGYFEGFLPSAQRKLRKVVNVILVLACILIATKSIIGAVQQPHSEIIMFIIKVSLIVYLTNGSAMSSYYNMILDLSMGLSDIILDGAGNTTVCDYKPSDYPMGSPAAKSYGYLAQWDRLDCRMAFYLGGHLNGEAAGTFLVLLSCSVLIFVALIFGNIYILVSVVSLFATLMFILIISWMLYLFVLSMISITILILLSPIFLPMMLFQVTKNFFDAWLKEIITYTLYPVMLFAFLGFMFSVYDNLYFNGLEFERDPGTVPGTNMQRIWYRLRTEKDGSSYDQCSMTKHQSTLACVLSTYQLKRRAWIFGIELTDFEFKLTETESLWIRLFITGLLGFLFYHFLSTLGSLAAELAGNPRGDISRGVKSPSQMMQGAIGAFSKVRDKVNSAARKGIDKVGEKLGAAKEKKAGQDSVGSGSAEKSGSRGSSGGGSDGV